MPTIGPTPKSKHSAPRQFDAAALLARATADKLLLNNALDVVRMLDRLEPEPLPDRPEVLEWDDGQIVEAYEKATRTGKSSGPAKQQLQVFTAWRFAVEQAEVRRGSNLLLVIHAIVRCEGEGENYDAVRTLRAWVRDHFGAFLPDPCPDSWKAKEQLAMRLAQDRQTFPIWLRLMTTPPAGKGTESSGSHDDD